MPRTFTEGRAGVLAIDPRAVGAQYDEGKPTSSEQQQSIAVICIEGPLEQRAGWFGQGYDSILECFKAALASDAAAVVLKINSPGGDAAGNIECARAMIAAKEAAGKPVIAYADEAAYSAAFAIACVADERYLPDTGGVGSVGCLCVAADVTKMVANQGIKAVVVRSGTKKAQGHPLIPLDADTLAAAQLRVDTLAEIFAGLVSEATGVSTKRLLSYQGACFYGKDAVKAGLSDGVMGWDDVILGLTTRLAQLAPVAQPVSSSEKQAQLEHQETGTMNLTQLFAALAAAQAAGDEAKVASIQAQITAVQAEEDSEEEDSEEDSEEESKKDPPPSDDDDDGDDDDDEDSEEEEEEPEEEEEETKKTTTVKTYRRSKKSQARLESALAAAFPGLSAAQIQGKLLALTEGAPANKKLEAKVAKLEGQARKSKVESLISKGIKQGKITPGQKEFWREQGMKSPAMLKSYLETAVAHVARVPAKENPNLPGPTGLTSQETEICTRMAISPAKFAETRTQLATQGPMVLSRIGA